MHTANEHNHAELMKGKKQLMSEEMINYINQLFDKGVMKYSQIIQFVEEERTNNNIFLDEPIPAVRQIEYID